jgi:hypothetical protein
LFIYNIDPPQFSGPAPVAEFKADIHKKWKEKSEEQKRRELVS